MLIKIDYEVLKMNKIKIEFFHDVICSFCYPMSYQMRQIQKEFPEIEIIHKSFALVKEASDFNVMFASREAAKLEILTHWEQANKIDPLHRFNIAGMLKESFPFPTSMKPLQACKAAGYMGGQSAYWEVFDALQKALFTENKDINEDSIILEKVQSTGLDLEEWKTLFHSKEIAEAVEADFKLGDAYGIYVVPTLVINGKEKLQGAIPIEDIRKTLKNLL